MSGMNPLTMAFDQFPPLSSQLDLTRVVQIVDAFSDAVHEHAPQSWFYLDQAHRLSGRMRTLEKQITDWDSHTIRESGNVTISDEEFLALEEETQSIRMAAKGIHGYFNYHLPRIQGEVPSNPNSQASSQDSTLSFSIGSLPSSYQSGISSDSSAATSYGWMSTPPDHANTPSHHRSDVTSPLSTHWGHLNHENGSVTNYEESDGGASSGSIFSSASAYAARARARPDTPASSVGQSSISFRIAQ